VVDDLAMLVVDEANLVSNAAVESDMATGDVTDVFSETV
jgi:hypothetical protein